MRWRGIDDANIDRACIPEREPALTPDRGGGAELGSQSADRTGVRSSDGWRAARGDPDDERPQGPPKPADRTGGRAARSQDADHLRLVILGHEDDRPADLRPN